MGEKKLVGNNDYIVSYAMPHIGMDILSKKLFGRQVIKKVSFIN